MVQGETCDTKMLNSIRGASEEDAGEAENLEPGEESMARKEMKEEGRERALRANPEESQ